MAEELEALDKEFEPSALELRDPQRIEETESERKIQLCGDHLREMIKSICRNYGPTPQQYYTPAGISSREDKLVNKY